jgi:hypothetical protein
MTARTNRRFRTGVKARLREAYRGTSHTIVTPIIKVQVVHVKPPKLKQLPRPVGTPGNTPRTLRIPPTDDDV